MAVCTDTSLNRSVHRTLLSFLLCIPIPASGQIHFLETSQSAGVWTTFAAYGVSVMDYDRDGWDDILFAGQSGVALLRNNSNGTFSDVTEAAGLRYRAFYAVGLWADWDNDGDADLFLGRRDTVDRNRILRNDSGVFTDVDAGIDATVRIGSAAAGDYDNDGRVDLYLSTRDAPDQLYTNASSPGNIAFSNATEKSGMKGISYSIGMQPTWIDFDRDGDQDLFVVHDGFDLSRLHQNTGALPFPNIAGPLSIANVGAGNSMGVAWGDIDNDGWQDVYVSRIDSGGLYQNMGGRGFKDIAGIAGADSNGMSWGVVFADLDNDGWEDIAIVNVSSFGGAHPASLLFRNRQDGTFHEIGQSSGFGIRQDMFGLATGDFNNDGLIDLVAASSFPIGQNRLWMNRTSNQNRWVKIRLEGQGGVNTMAIGARVRARAGGTNAVRSLLAGSSYCSQVSSVLHIGLGSSSAVDTLEIIWKGDHKEIFTNLPADTLHTIRRSGTTGTTGVRASAHGPEELRIWSVFPNPFNGSTMAQFDQPQEGMVRIAIVDMIGREVRFVTEGRFTAGRHTIPIDMSGLPSGVYFVRVHVRETAATAPIVLMR